MNFQVELSDHFKKEAKRLIKKYNSLAIELEELFNQLAENPVMGTPLGNDVFKIRLGIASKNKGKSGGARVIAYVQIDKQAIVLLSIYNKGDKDNISDDEIDVLIHQFLDEYK